LGRSKAYRIVHGTQFDQHPCGFALHDGIQGLRRRAAANPCADWPEALGRAGPFILLSGQIPPPADFTFASILAMRGVMQTASKRTRSRSVES
jgi:hypothetical protein